MSIRILNRTGQPPKDGWYQIEVTGTHPASKDRRQQIDETALKSIVNRFAEDKAAAGDNWAGLLVDNDHLSHDPSQSTEALAWAQELDIRNGQLWGRLDLTDLGDQAVRNKRFKFFSTEYDAEDLEDLGNGVFRPLRLSGLAMTNRPNNRGGKPISNRRSGEEPGNPNHDTKNDTMKSIAEQLGLPATADEAAIKNAVTQLQSANAGAEADKILNRFGGRVPETMRAAWRERLIANRADTEKLMETTFPEGSEKKGSGKAPVFNRAGATPPDPVEGQDGEGKGKEEEQRKAAAIQNRATELRSHNPRLSYPDSFNQARNELR